uniref:Uncharacterized protein n=1 Tax=Anguilla anguilla TaxID=7936 RepID=A0A0E9TLA6_ANGAN
MNLKSENRPGIVFLFFVSLFFDPMLSSQLFPK